VKSTETSVIRQRPAKRRYTATITMAAVAAAISIPASFALSGGVEAGAKPTSPPACASLSGTPNTSATIGKCRPAPKGKAAKGYKKGSLQLNSEVLNALVAGGTVTESLTWTSSGAATTIQFSGTPSSPAGCKKGSTELDLVGSVIGASTSGRGIPAVGDTFNAPVCMSPSEQFSLPKGSKFRL
jgi:hypothetical protein